MPRIKSTVAQTPDAIRMRNSRKIKQLRKALADMHAILDRFNDVAYFSASLPGYKELAERMTNDVAKHKAFMEAKAETERQRMIDQSYAVAQAKGYDGTRDEFAQMVDKMLAEAAKAMMQMEQEG